LNQSKKAFAGYAWVATRDSGDVAIVDLAAFKLSGRIKTSGKPVQLLDVPNDGVILSVAENGAVDELSVREDRVLRTLPMRVAPGQLWLGMGGELLWAIQREPNRLVAIDRKAMTVRRSWNLPEAAGDIALASEANGVAVSLPQSRRVAMLADPAAGELRFTSLPKKPEQIRFLKNGSTLLVTQEGERQLTLVDAASGRIVVHLPLPILPRNLCFSADGGQLFITGEGLDAVVVVYPFQSQVAATLLSGKAPGPMAVSNQPQFLFVTSPSTDTVSVLDVRSQKLAAVVAVGADPRCVTITPDSQMALVLNHRSGDMAIIRLANIISKRAKTAPLFTMIPVGSAPVAAVVRGI
jgi:YVTN family beta-propeller protein